MSYNGRELKHLPTEISMKRYNIRIAIYLIYLSIFILLLCKLYCYGTYDLIFSATYIQAYISHNNGKKSEFLINLYQIVSDRQNLLI